MVPFCLCLPTRMKTQQGQGYSLLYFQCLEWHLVHKEIFVEGMDALLLYGHVYYILFSLTKKSGFGFEY